MAGEPLEIRTEDGVAPARLFRPSTGSGPWPGVILYMDVFGPRPALWDMARRLADAGHLVLVPDLFYRAGAWGPVEPSRAYADPAVMEQVMGLRRAFDNEMVRSDTRSYLAALAALPDMAGPVGAVGYCMGGGCALTALAGFSDRVKAAASFHGGALATDKPDSPHRMAGTMRGRAYVGVAGIDAHFGAEEEGRLAKALREADVDHVIETYAGVRHGWAVSDQPVYDAAAAEKHWRRLLELFAETLRG